MRDRIKQVAMDFFPATIYGLVRTLWRTIKGEPDNLPRFLRSRSGVIARFVRHPWPMRAPWRRKLLNIARNGALGDVLMCTPALRELKLKNRHCYVRFYTDYPGLVRGLPYIDEVRPYDERPEDTIKLWYEDAKPPHAHLARIFGDNLGLNVTNVRPDCVIDTKLVERFRKSFRALPRPHIVMHRRASAFTPNKAWPENYWLELMSKLSKQASLIEIGNRFLGQELPLANYVDLRDQTSLEELVSLIAAADILVGPVSGPIHVAAAAGTPAVVIIGGYEHPINTSYDGMVSFYTPLACSPCWLMTPCPFDLKCLKMIGPDTVESAIWNIWGSRKLQFE